jgi:hypothetical protein
VRAALRHGNIISVLAARTIGFPAGLTVLSGHVREDRTTQSRRHGTRWTELEHAIDSIGGDMGMTARSRIFQSSRIARWVEIAGKLAGFQGGIKAFTRENTPLSEVYGD